MAMRQYGLHQEQILHRVSNFLLSTSPVGLNQKPSFLTYLLLIPWPALQLRFQRVVPSFRAFWFAQSAVPAICLIRT